MQRRASPNACTTYDHHAISEVKQRYSCKIEKKKLQFVTCIGFKLSNIWNHVIRHIKNQQIGKNYFPSRGLSSETRLLISQIFFWPINKPNLTK